jgi:hypothetical protein
MTPVEGVMQNASKYDPLQKFLAQAHGDEIPMRFSEIERVLGFELPASARRHPAWWSNNHGTNVAVNAWRSAGFRTSRVEIGGERVVFLREDPSAQGGASHAAPGVSEAGVFVAFEQLTPAARRLLDDYCEEAGESAGEAIAKIVHHAALERRKALMEKFARLSPRVSGDSTDLIREDRDAR